MKSPALRHLNERYVNREYSWLQFNRRVLEEAANEANPPLERIKFLAIFESNLDEFFMVRVSGLVEQVESGVKDLTPEGLTPFEQLQIVSAVVAPMRKRAAQIWESQLLPALAQHGILFHTVESLTEQQRAKLEEHFLREVFPVCTPLILHPAHTVPFISNRSLNLAVELHDAAAGAKLGRVKIPDVLPRLIRFGRSQTEFVWLEDVVKANLKHLFPGVTIKSSARFRVLRDAEIEIRELEAADLVATVERTIHMRRFGDPVLLEVEPGMAKGVRKQLMQLLKLLPADLLTSPGLIGFDGLWELAALDKPALKFAPHHPYHSEHLEGSDNLFATVRKADALVHHPFDSFQSVEDFVASAAIDPDVIGIKQTMYRVGAESPIVEDLLQAAAKGKQVAAMVELKARFDESNNLVWAKALERAGVHVTYGFAELKTHAKLCLIVRREKGTIRRYAHIGTGNYNPATARVYTDLGLFTANPEITQDISELFNFLTGFSKQEKYRRLLVAPINLRDEIIARIERETRIHKKTGKGRIIFKLNALVDPEVIDALYEASIVGVRIDVIARGICCLRPGLKGMSQNIRVVSIVGRFLEHSRAYYFENGGSPEVYIGSADMMRRNLDRRIETLVPVQDPSLIQLILRHILEPYLTDNQNAWEMNSVGEYSRIAPKKGESPFSAQKFLCENPAAKLHFAVSPDTRVSSKKAKESTGKKRNSN